MQIVTWIFLVVTALIFLVGIVALAVSGWGFYRLISNTTPLLTETRDNVQDLGDLAANTVGRVADTVDLVELRVSQTMAQATQGGVSATKQALSVGTILAGIYMASRVFGMAREQFRAPNKNNRSKKNTNKKDKRGRG